MQHACVVRELMFLLSDCANYRQRGDGKVTMLKQEITAGPSFTSSDEYIGELLGHMHEIADLSALDALSGWDQNTAMPEGGSEMRGAQQATLQGVLHERWTAPRLGSLLDELGEKVQQAPYTDADRGLVREGRRGYDRATKLPRARDQHDLAAAHRGQWQYGGCFLPGRAFSCRTASGVMQEYAERDGLRFRARPDRPIAAPIYYEFWQPI